MCGWWVDEIYVRPLVCVICNSFFFFNNVVLNQICKTIRNTTAKTKHVMLSWPLNWGSVFEIIAVFFLWCLFAWAGVQAVTVGVAGGWTDECTVIYCLASWYSGSASSNHNGWEGTLCVACDARKRGVSHSLMSPLSLRADSHSETLTGCPEAGARVMEERKRRGERRKCDIKTIREIPNPSGKQEKKRPHSYCGSESASSEQKGY